MIWIASNINDLIGTGLIYTGTRVDTKIYARWLQFINVDAVEYNAGFDADTRKDIEKGLIENRWKCIVSTNALGMGIDKSDIRFIIHTQIPVSPIHYYQEIGRAGRDGKPTRIILFFNESKNNKADDYPTDYTLPFSFIESSRPAIKKYIDTIELLKESPLSEHEIMKKLNLKQNQIRVIKADLIDQGIIKEAHHGTKSEYEYQYGAKNLDTSMFEELRKAKIKDLNSMVEYVYTDIPRMEFLCKFLDSDENSKYANCDNTNLPKLHIEHDEELSAKLEEFRDSFFPELEVADSTLKPGTGLKVKTPYPNTVEILKNNEVVVKITYNIDYKRLSEEEKSIVSDLIDKHKDKASRLTNGYAASYYGVSNVGSALHRSKYENGGDFPDFLLKKTLSVFRKKFGNIKFDIVLYVPPTHSGDLVKNFTVKFANTVKIPVSHKLKKTRKTAEQKIFQNSYGKQDNVKDAFTIDANIVKGKTILLIDDIYDSGATLKEIGRMLTNCGAKWIVPIVIAKTAGDTL